MTDIQKCYELHEQFGEYFRSCVAVLKKMENRNKTLAELRPIREISNFYKNICPDADHKYHAF